MCMSYNFLRCKLLDNCRKQCPEFPRPEVIKLLIIIRSKDSAIEVEAVMAQGRLVVQRLLQAVSANR